MEINTLLWLMTVCAWFSLWIWTLTNLHKVHMIKRAQASQLYDLREILNVDLLFAEQRVVYNSVIEANKILENEICSS